MKSTQQKRFEKLVTTIILCEPYITARAGVLDDFKYESEVYYDRFCDKVYEFIHAKQSNSLLIDERGLAHLEQRTKNPQHVYFRILSQDELSDDIDDIIVYIEQALNNLEEELLKIQRNFL